MNRLNSLQKKISDEKTALFIKNPSNIFYITGLNITDAGTVFITKNNAYYIVDFRYIEVAQKSTKDGITVLLEDNLFSQINDICNKENIKNIYIESSYIPFNVFNNLTSKLKDYYIKTEYDVNKIISEFRMIKDEQEIENILSAQKITDRAFTHILDFIKPGVREKDLALELEFYMRKNGASAPSFDIIFVGGKNTSLPHGVPSEYKLQNGDFITMDFGAVYNNYRSDMTRTVALGSVSNEQKMVYTTVLDAQKLALNEIKSGVKCNQIDTIARNYIYDNGYKGCFGHSLGHSVGIDIHEEPNFSPKCDQILMPNMVLTVEPGIYIENKFGVRIEDIVVITQNGCKNITKSDKSLIIL